MVVFWLVLVSSLPAFAATGDFSVVISQNGETRVNDVLFTKTLDVQNDKETLLVPIYQFASEPVETVTISLRVPVTMPVEWQPRPIPSKCVCQTRVKRISAQEFQITVNGIIRGSQVSLSADFPVGTFQLTASQKAALGIERISPWLIGLAIILLLASLGVLIWLATELASLRKFKLTPTLTNAPPNEIEPAVISAIPSGKITQATLGAMLISLAQRGYLLIEHSDRTFHITENKKVDLTGPGFALGSLPGDIIPAAEIEKAKAEGLSLAEKYLLSKLFTEGHFSVSEDELRQRFGRRLSSWKIGKLYAELYKQLAGDGFFIRNPHEVHLKYRGLGIGIFFTGLAGFVGSFFLPGNPLFLELMWAIVALCGYIITRIVPYLPLLTVMGQAEWARWAGFRLYLGAREPIPASERGRFFDYFAYAVALNELPAWARRFGNQQVVLPHWYRTTTDHQPADVALKDLGGFVEHVAKALSAMHEHTVR